MLSPACHHKANFITVKTQINRLYSITSRQAKQRPSASTPARSACRCSQTSLPAGGSRWVTATREAAGVPEPTCCATRCSTRTVHAWTRTQPSPAHKDIFTHTNCTAGRREGVPHPTQQAGQLESSPAKHITLRAATAPSPDVDHNPAHIVMECRQARSFDCSGQS